MENLFRTRFAPSPTGFLHIGGARTALFNYIFAKQNKGKFILRIEDTDLNRNRNQFIKSQYKDLCWLFLKPDESPFDKGEYEPYFQSKRLNIYWKYINQLLEKKKAYYCFCTLEEIEKEKQEYINKNKKSNFQYSRKCLNLSEKEIKDKFKNNENYVIRFFIDKTKIYELNDLVKGKIIFKGIDIEDFILCRSNLFPLLNLAVVVDDYLMKITYILRGEEHLTNTAKQLVLYEALELKIPFFAHISIILDNKNKKLSKRSQNNEFQLIYQLKELGYLPEAIINYLLLLGWHPGTTQEFFSLEEAIEKFNLKGLQKSGAIYDLEKLKWYNKNYIQKLPQKIFCKFALKFLKKKYILNKTNIEKLKKICIFFNKHISCFQELIELTKFFFFKSKKNNNKILENLQKEIKNNIKEWNYNTIINLFKEFKTENYSKKDFYHLIREQLTGKNEGLKIIDLFYLLGKEEVINRLF